MADTKISGLPASTVPLAGTEVLPIVQSSTTKQVSIANVTAGRAVSALSVTATADTTPSSSLGAFNYGTLSYADVNHLATFQTSVASYAQVEIQNTSTDPAASSDMVVGNSLTTASTYYGDFGMNSSGWIGTAPFNTANNVYLTATNASLALGTTTSNTLLFATNSTLAATISTAQVLSTVNDATIHGVTVGLGGNAQSLNTVVGGANSMINNTTGNSITSVGNASLVYNTTGGSLTSIGRGAMSFNTVGSNSTSVGALSLQYNTTVGNLTAVGTQALNNNTTNVATLGSITSGGTGYAGGGSAGPFTVTLSTTSGATFVTYPTAAITVTSGVITACTLVSAGIGASSTAATVLTATSAAMVAAGFASGGSGLSIAPTFASGTGNVAVGYQAGFTTSVATNNTYNGYQAGYGVTTGSNSVFMGYGSGNTTTVTTTGNQLVYIGSGSKGSAATNQNEIVIGYNAVGLGSNTTIIGNASTTATYNGNNSAAWSIISDARIKKNVISLDLALDVISALRPVEFDYIENDKHDIGFIAQEYQIVLPTQVIEQDNGMLGLNQNLTPYIVKAIQELNAKFDAYVALHP